MASSLQPTIDRLKAVLLDPNCKNMNQSTVVSFLSEIIVKEKLEQEGFTVEHKGNQASDDLIINGRVKVDVKASRIQKEPSFKGEYDFWGYCLLAKSKREMTSSHLVCVAFNKNLSVYRYYVIKADHVRHFPPSIKRFKAVLHCFNIFDFAPPIAETSPWHAVRAGCAKVRELGYVVEVKPDETLGDKIMPQR